jgi:hypothetical protein
MVELFEAVASWPTLLLTLLVFGFAPGFVLRLLVLAYPRSDPRRRELIAELYTVPRVQRPMWVAEQLEVALFEGFAHRVSATIRSFARQRRVPAQTDKRGGLTRTVAWAMAWAMAVAMAGAGALTGALTGAVAGAALVSIVSDRGKPTARQRLSARARRRFRP